MTRADAAHHFYLELTSRRRHSHTQPAAWHSLIWCKSRTRTLSLCRALTKLDRASSDDPSICRRYSPVATTSLDSRRQWSLGIDCDCAPKSSSSHAKAPTTTVATETPLSATMTGQNYSSGYFDDRDQILQNIVFRSKSAKFLPHTHARTTRYGSKSQFAHTSARRDSLSWRAVYVQRGDMVQTRTTTMFTAEGNPIDCRRWRAL